MSTCAEAGDEWALVHPDERVARVASRQRGVVRLDQLVACGLTRKAVATRVRRGQLTRVHRGVYLVGHRAPIPFAREAAALLACGEESVLSHRSAGALWGLVSHSLAAAVEVSVPRHIRREGIRAHRTGAREWAVREGLRVTTPARTIADLAATLTRNELERVVAEARANHLVRLDEVEPTPGRPGAANLRAVLDEGPRWTRSHAERRLLEIVRRAGLPLPETNVTIAGCQVDALWREERVAVEVDSWAFHGDRASFERDRRRDAKLRAAGLTPVRVTARALEAEPHAIVADLAGELARARARAA